MAEGGRVPCPRRNMSVFPRCRLSAGVVGNDLGLRGGGELRHPDAWGMWVSAHPALGCGRTPGRATPKRLTLSCLPTCVCVANVRVVPCFLRSVCPSAQRRQDGRSVRFSDKGLPVARPEFPHFLFFA